MSFSSIKRSREIRSMASPEAQFLPQMESGSGRIAVLLAALKHEGRVPRMRRNGPLLRRGALLIRRPMAARQSVVPALRCTAKRRCTASGIHEMLGL
jgi:hypothetical protein